MAQTPWRNFLAIALTLILAAPSLAAQSADELARLGKDLTPLGAVQAGNADGTIPAWDGGISKPPAGYQKGKHHPDPFADDAIAPGIGISEGIRWFGRLVVVRPTRIIRLV